MARVVPTDWLPKAAAQRVIVHWTGGGPVATPLDREHYHILVNQDLTLVRGTHTVADNDNTSDGDYAAHTRNCNSKSVGVSLCGMLNAVQSPFYAGPYPIKESQWDRAAQVVAEVCARYGIPVTPQTVLQHGEVPENLGIPQLGKWDVCKLPWEPTWTEKRVGDDFRMRVTRHLGGEDERPRRIEAIVLGVDVPAYLHDSQAVFAIRPLADAGRLKIDEADGNAIVFTYRGKQHVIARYVLDGVGFVPARKFATLTVGELEWDAASRRLTITPASVLA